jgi:hypothetical protein
MPGWATAAPEGVRQLDRMLVSGPAQSVLHELLLCESWL